MAGTVSPTPRLAGDRRDGLERCSGTNQDVNRLQQADRLYIASVGAAKRREMERGHPSRGRGP